MVRSAVDAGEVTGRRKRKVVRRPPSNVEGSQVTFAFWDLLGAGRVCKSSNQSIGELNVFKPACSCFEV